MLKFQLRRAIDYAYARDYVTRQTVNEFFGGPPPYDPQDEKFEDASSLFNEWLIFEYQPKKNTNIITEYYLRDPDELSPGELKELKDIVESQFYEWVEIVSKKAGRWFKAYGLFTGKTYTIHDINASINLPDKGSFYVRLAKVNNQWHSVGSNPLVMPLSHTNRLKNSMRLKPGEKSRLSCRDTLDLILPQPDQQQTFFTRKEIKAKQKKIEKKYNKICKKQGIQVAFPEVLDFIYNENYQTNFSDWLKDITKLGFEFGFIANNLGLFQDAWNFFPHKKLDGKPPAQMCSDIYGESKET